MSISMKQVNKKYRCIMEMDEKGVIKHDGDKIDVETAMIFCDTKARAHICKYDDSTFIAYVYSSNMFNKWVKDLKGRKVRIDEWLLDGEGEFRFNEKDLDVVCEVLKAKKQGKANVGINNFVRNRGYYLRLLEHIDPLYKAKLKKSPKWQ